MCKIGKNHKNCCGAFFGFFHFHQRYIIAILCGFGAILIINARNCTPSVLSHMQTMKSISITEETSQCPRGPSVAERLENFQLPIDITEETQSVVTLSFYVGDIIAHVPLGMLSDHYGAKWTLFSCLLASSILSALSPIVLGKLGAWGLTIINIFLGCSHGGVVPSFAVVLAHWFPPNEHSRFGALLTSTGLLGNVMSHLLTLYLLKRKRDWTVVYYSSAGLCALWCVLFGVLCYSAPESHPYISEKEKSYLSTNRLNVSKHSELAPVPWRLMLTSLPVWAYIVMHVGHDWVVYGLIGNMPKYLHDVLRFSHRLVAIWASTAVIMLWMTSIAWGFFSDHLLYKGYMSLKDMRKMNTMIAGFGPGILLLFCSYARCHLVLVILFFTLCMCASGPFFSGAKLSSIDLAPNYAGTLMGISNGLAALGILVPSIIYIVNKKKTLDDWRNGFWFDFCVIASAAVIYILFGSSQLQKWNFGSDNVNRKEEKTIEEEI